MTGSIGHRGPGRRRSAGRGQRRHRDAPPGDRRSQPVRSPAAVQRDRLSRGRVQRRDLQPARPALAPGAGRTQVPGHQRHRGAGPRLRAVGRQRADPSGWPACSRSRCSIGRAGGCSWRATASASSRSTCGEPRRSSRSPRSSARSRTTAAGRSSIDPQLRAHVPAARVRAVAGQRVRRHREAGARDACGDRSADRRHAHRDVLPPRARGASRTCAPTRCWNGCASCSTPPCAGT